MLNKIPSIDSELQILDIIEFSSRIGLSDQDLDIIFPEHNDFDHAKHLVSEWQLPINKDINLSDFLKDNLIYNSYIPQDSNFKFYMDLCLEKRLIVLDASLERFESGITYLSKIKLPLEETRKVIDYLDRLNIIFCRRYGHDNIYLIELPPRDKDNHAEINIYIHALKSLTKLSQDKIEELRNIIQNILDRYYMLGLALSRVSMNKTNLRLITFLMRLLAVYNSKKINENEQEFLEFCFYPDNLEVLLNRLESIAADKTEIFKTTNNNIVNVETNTVLIILSRQNDKYLLKHNSEAHEIYSIDYFLLTFLKDNQRQATKKIEQLFKNDKNASTVSNPQIRNAKTRINHIIPDLLNSKGKDGYALNSSYKVVFE